MTTLTHTSATEGQVRQLSRVASDAADGAVRNFSNLSKEGAQQVHGDSEFAERVRRATVLALTELSGSNRYADEEAESSSSYPSDYSPKSITEQIRRLRQLFPGLDLVSADEMLAEEDLPTNAEGWFAIPRWEKIAPTYNEVVQRTLELIELIFDHKLRNHCAGQLGPHYLGQSTRTASVFQKFGDKKSKYDFFVIPAQFGFLHRGRSVRRAREVFTESEFGLGVFEVGVMLLTHPERLQHCDDLWIDCAGDEFSPNADGNFSSAPYFDLRYDRVEFGACGVRGSYGKYGSASGFVLKS